MAEFAENTGYRIVGDSCCDFTKEDLAKDHIRSAPLELRVGERFFTDNPRLNCAALRQAINTCPECPRSSCPSPGTYLETYEGAEELYVVTMTSKLSGSYSSAVTAASLYRENHPDAKIKVFDTKMASCGQHIVVRKIRELKEQGFSFERTVEKVEQFIAGAKMYFVLDRLDTLRKNGRLSGVKALAAGMLHLKPILAAREGEIVQIGIGRGSRDALHRMVEIILKEVENTSERVLSIAHCACPERADTVRWLLCEKAHWKDVEILETHGVSTVYANEGGVLVSC